MLNQLSNPAGWGQIKKTGLLEFRKDETNANVKRWIEEYVRGLEGEIARAKIAEERRQF
jgi:hypothetical protein